MTFFIPGWRSLKHSKEALNHPKKVTSRIARIFFWQIAVGELMLHATMLLVQRVGSGPFEIRAEGIPPNSGET